MSDWKPVEHPLSKSWSDVDTYSQAWVENLQAEAERLRAWVDHWWDTGCASHRIRMDILDFVRAGAWPDGREA